MAERLRVMLASSGTRPAVPHPRASARSPRRRARSPGSPRRATDRQIAEKLFLSEKTVEAHLSHSYRGNWLRTRTQLAVRLAVSVGG